MNRPPFRPFDSARWGEVPMKAELARTRITAPAASVDDFGNANLDLSTSGVATGPVDGPGSSVRRYFETERGLEEIMRTGPKRPAPRIAHPHALPTITEYTVSSRRRSRCLGHRRPLLVLRAPEAPRHHCHAQNQDERSQRPRKRTRHASCTAIGNMQVQFARSARLRIVPGLFRSELIA